MYSRLISPYFDFQAGLRYARRWGEGPSHSRAYAVVGVEGLAPYRFEIEPSLQVSQQGKVQFRLAASYDLLITQRLVVQPKLETSLALQKDNEFGILSHINDSEVGLRIRYEVRREFAPYIGVSWSQGFGSLTTSSIGGFEPNFVSLVLGVRLWH
jgi:copper resistance protein B